MSSRADRSRVSLIFLDAVLAAACYVLAARFCLDIAAGVYLLYEDGALSIAIVVASILLAGHFQNWYTGGRPYSRVSVILSAITVVGVAFLLQALVHYIEPTWALPMPIMLYGSIAALVVLAASHLCYHAATGTSFGPAKILMIGTAGPLLEIERALRERPQFGMQVIGYIDEEMAPGTVQGGAAVLGSMARFAEICRTAAPDRVVADIGSGSNALPAASLRKLAASGVPVERPESLYELLFRRACIGYLADSALLSSEFAPPRNIMAVQSIYNNLAALVAIITLAPLMVLIAVLVKLSSGGPVLERQLTTGWNLVPFTLLRFRCTHIRRTPGREQTALTPVGALLRRFHLDSLPLLFNLLRGEMALVGPPPVRTEFAQVLMETLPCYRLRFRLKPGIFGWRQISLPPDSDATDVTAGLAYDLYYIRHASVALDCSILLRAWAPLFQRKANHAAAQALAYR